MVLRLGGFAQKLHLIEASFTKGEGGTGHWLLPSPSCRRGSARRHSQQIETTGKGNPRPPQRPDLEKAPGVGRSPSSTTFMWEGGARGRGRGRALPGSLSLLGNFIWGGGVTNFQCHTPPPPTTGIKSTLCATLPPPHMGLHMDCKQKRNSFLVSRKQTKRNP
ncbi:UNVERIFIED_CONTAM: hypothetical protein K2H54_040840 [Gekko kuhli]